MDRIVPRFEVVIMLLCLDFSNDIWITYVGVWMGAHLSP